MSRLIEKYIQVVRQSGLITQRPVDFSNAPSVALPTGTTINGSPVESLGSLANLVSSSANAFAIGPTGSTNPTFNVDASTASAVTGLTVKSSTATAGVFLNVTSSGTNENLVLVPKGTSGQLRSTAANNFFGASANGAAGTALKIGSFGDASNAYVAATGSVTDVGLRLRGQGAGVVSVQDSIPTPAGGSATASLIFGSTTGFGIYYGSGAPTVSAAQGSIYLRSDGSSTSTRMYVNNSSGSGTTWTAVTTAA